MRLICRFFVISALFVAEYVFVEGIMTVTVVDRHIEITPGVANGKPRITGRRITVQNIVVWHEHLGKTADEICAEYDLTLADVYAALAYYFDHREEIDQSLREDERFVEALHKQTPSVWQTRIIITRHPVSLRNRVSFSDSLIRPGAAAVRISQARHERPPTLCATLRPGGAP